MNAPPLVLYAEDDENDAFFMERAFARLHRRCALRIVPNGRHVIDYLAEAGAYRHRHRFPLPALLILDVKMPELTGLEVLHWVRRQEAPFASLPVVIFTSSTQEKDVARSREDRASAYLVKPSSADHLVLLVDELLNALPGLPPGGLLPVQGNRLLSSP